MAVSALLMMYVSWQGRRTVPAHSHPVGATRPVLLLLLLKVWYGVGVSRRHKTNVVAPVDLD